MKKIIFIFALMLTSIGFGFAGSLDYHVGAGYHSSYAGTAPNPFGSYVGNTQAMPLGIGVYGGLGYGFGDREIISLGAELALSMDFALSSLAAWHFVSQTRIYLKFTPIELLTITAFGGSQSLAIGGSQSALPSDWWVDSGSLIIGARLTVSFIYAEYSAVFPIVSSGDNGISKHGIGLGFAFFR